MMIHKITPSEDYNWWLKRLDTKINKLTNQNSKDQNFVNSTNKKKL